MRRIVTWAAGLVVMAAWLSVAQAQSAGNVSDADVLAISQRHCTSCHARKPTHPGFTEAPNGVALETIPQLRQHASAIYAQTVLDKAMPLGNEHGMTQGEREALGRWLRASP